MPKLVTIPISFFEYVAKFERPVIQLWLERAHIVQSVFDSLIPWNAQIDNVEPKNDGKPADQGISIKLPDHKVSFFFGPAKCKFTKEAADWSQAEEIIRILDTARTALCSSSGAVIENQKAVIAMHIQPKTGSFRDILRPFLPDQMVQLRSGEIRTGAVVLRWNEAALTIDGSGSLANGVFIRLEQDFKPNINDTEIAEALFAYEKSILALLDLEEEHL